MRFITVNNTSKRDFHQFMLGSVTPRPIALVSTIDENGNRNLAPFSYFNAVSSVPPILMLSVGRKQDASKKDTLVNIEKTGEFVVNMVSFNLIMQMALSSVNLPPDADEFDLSGLHAVESEIVKPFRVKESRIHFECKVRDIIHLGDKAGESSLILGDVKCIHIDEDIIDGNNRINPAKLNIVGRLGRSHYTRIEESSVETIVLPQLEIPLGFNKLPGHLIKSEILSANDIGILASYKEKPSDEKINQLKQKWEGQGLNKDKSAIHQSIKDAISKKNHMEALQIAFAFKDL